MARKNLNLRQDYVANLPRTGFDMSRHFTFTSSTGMILPCYHDFLNPGETVSIDCNMFTRMQPVITAAMADIDQKIDWFFVPASMLYTLFPSAFFGTDDYLTSFYGDGDGHLAQEWPKLYLPEIPETVDPYGDVAAADSMQILLGDADIDNVSPENFESCMVSAYRLLNMLGIPPRYVLSKTSGAFQEWIDKSVAAQDEAGIENPVGQIYGAPNSQSCVSPLNFWYTILAYNCIYQKFYRPEEYERLNVSLYNIDAKSNREPYSELDLRCMFVRYHTRYKDYFNSSFLTPLADTNNLIGNSSSPYSLQQLQRTAESVNSYFSEFLSFEEAVRSPYSADFGSDSVGSVNFQNSSGDSTASPANVRAAFAFEKYIRVLGRARKTYDAQVLAHFGYRVPHDVMHQISYIGGFDGELKIGAVISTADTMSAAGRGAPVGEVGGNGVGQLSGKPLKFTAPCHGVLMACIYSLPRQPLEYAYGLDKSNVIRGLQDLYVPEFDKLGMQPLFNYEFMPFVRDETAQGGVSGMTTFNRWQYRYSQWKRKYDVFSMAFIDSGRVNAFNLGSQSGVNIYSSWLTGRKPVYTNELQIPYWDVFCPPTAINSIMQIPYQGSFSPMYLTYPWLMFQRDPFINDLQCNVYKVSTMSAYGEPDLDR